MDPISKALTQFQDEFRGFRRDSATRVLRITTGPEHVGLLARVLRAEEWQLDNQSPFLVFETAYSDEGETVEAMNRAVREHYAGLQKAFSEQGRSLPAFQVVPEEAPDAIAGLVAHIRAFRQGTERVLETPLVCWMPTNVDDPDRWRAAIARLLRSLWSEGYRFVVTDGEDSLLSETLDELGNEVATARFEIDDAATRAHVRKLISPPSAGRAPGTMPGAAAPDVAPPPRPGPPRPTDEQVQAVAREMGLPPMLAPDEAERFRMLVLQAAFAAGEKNERLALEMQQAACDLCAGVGVKLEEAVMTLLLASYLLQFGREAEAEAAYRRADILAGEAGALPQVAQARMALAYLVLKNERLDEAAQTYEQAAAAAAVGEANLLYFESLRMAGTCHLQAGRQYDAMMCWQAAVERGRVVSSDEVRLSGFLDVSARLIELLRQNGLHDQAASVEALVSELGEKMNVEAEVAS